MAEFHFYCLGEDYGAIVNAVCEDSPWRVMPCWHHTSDVPTYAAYCADLGHAIRTNRRLFVSGPFSLDGAHTQLTPRGNYAIAFEKCGPLIGLTLGGSRTKDTIEHIWPATLEYKTSYITKDGRSAKPSQELKAAYADIVGRLKRLCTKIRVQKWLYATDSVSQIMQDGRALLKLDGVWEKPLSNGC